MVSSIQSRKPAWTTTPGPNAAAQASFRRGQYSCHIFPQHRPLG